jgi:ATP-dependent Clp protease protease subunit
LSDIDLPSLSDNIIERDGDTVYFYDDCNEKTIHTLKTYLRAIKKERYPMANIVIGSLGGYDMSIYEFIKGLGIPVHTWIDGWCASAATMIFVAGAKRYISDTAVLLIHSAQASLDGTFSKGGLKDVDDMSKIITDRMRYIYERECKIPPKELELLLSYKDRYLTPEECIKWKIAHEIKTYIGV